MKHNWCHGLLGYPSIGNACECYHCKSNFGQLSTSLFLNSNIDNYIMWSSKDIIEEINKKFPCEQIKLKNLLK